MDCNLNNRRVLARDEDLLGRAMECWESWGDFRKERVRCKQFTYGDQWRDMVYDRGAMVREEDLIRAQGNMPLKNNLIRRLVRNVLGVYRNRWEQPSVKARDSAESLRAAAVNKLLECNGSVNRIEEVYARTMEEFLISGLAVHKKWYGLRDGRVDCWTDMVSPDRFFMDSGSRDFRGGDLTMIGEVHEMRPDDLACCFASTPGHADSLLALYGTSLSDRRSRCRVWEVWERRRGFRLDCHDRLKGTRRTVSLDDEQSVRRENMRRAEEGLPLIETNWMPVDIWEYSFLAPGGEIIAHGPSPYDHGSHPYVYKAYPYIDGEIHSFVNDIIDQQKLTNRLISMYDWVLRASAKGVLLFPEGALPDGCDMADVLDEWSRFDGVIVYKPKPGVPLPQQVSSKASDIGITGLLEIQMKMMEDISGVNGALQGKLDNGSMSGTLYSQQTENSLSALADILKSFEDFTKRATAVDVANIRQFYTPSRIASISGRATPSIRRTRDFRDTCFDF